MTASWQHTIRGMSEKLKLPLQFRGYRQHTDPVSPSLCASQPYIINRAPQTLRAPSIAKPWQGVLEISKYSAKRCPSLHQPAIWLGSKDRHRQRSSPLRLPIKILLHPQGSTHNYIFHWKLSPTPSAWRLILVPGIHHTMHNRLARI